LKVEVLWFGRPAASPYEEAVEKYRRRVARRWPASDHPLRQKGGGRDADPARVLAAEAELARRRLAKGFILVVLDEAGEPCSSVEFARFLEGLEDTSASGAIFLVGSDLGISEGLRRCADRRLSLSAMTLPHLLARLVLWEQLYRATQILEGGRYHRHRVQ
jgi:23S rRNA (pseudouridine1915-N3)-methyltransferase